jgi:hypothetical protein
MFGQVKITCSVILLIELNEVIHKKKERKVFNEVPINMFIRAKLTRFK